MILFKIFLEEYKVTFNWSVFSFLKKIKNKRENIFI